VAVTEAKRNGKTAVKDGLAHGLPIRTRPQFPSDQTMPLAQSAAQDDNAKSVSFVPDPSQAAAKFLEAGLTLLEPLSSRCNADVARATDGFEPIKRGLSTLLRTDAQTQVPTLTIPLPEFVTAERLARVISGFLGNLAVLIRECVRMVFCSSSRQLHMDPKGAGAADILQRVSEHAEHAKVIDMAILDGYHMIL